MEDRVCGDGKKWRPREDILKEKEGGREGDSVMMSVSNIERETER